MALTDQGIFKPEWVFERNRRMGGAVGEAFTNTLNSTGMERPAVLAREAVQNSVDARADLASKVRVTFRTQTLSGSDKAAFLEAASLKCIAERKAVLALAEPNCVADFDKAGQPLSVVYIDDYNTTGLAGNPDDDSSKFYRFFLSIGDGSKVRDEHGTGGSYGFGKSVYSSNSAVQTIFAYSRTTDEAGNPMSLLFGAGYFKAHEHDGVRHTGRAWFGHDLTGEGPEQIVVPLRDDVADQFALSLGFTPRGNDEFGTSVLIVDASVDASGILRGVEDWWWPRLVSDGLDVEILPDGGEILIPRPRVRQHLRPFVEAYDVATGKSPEKAGREKRYPFNKIGSLGLGVCGIRVLERTDDDLLPVSEDRVDSIALIRSPKMVVAYYRPWSPSIPPSVGVFVADNDIDDILRASESAAHDKWDTDSQRLRDATGHKREVVMSALNRIKRSIKDFQRAASPPPPPRPRHLSLMEKALASFLNPSRVGKGPGPETSSAPIHLTYSTEPGALSDGASGLKLMARYSIRLKDEAEQDTLDVVLNAKCYVLADGVEEDEIYISTTRADGSELHASDEGQYPLKLERGKPIHLESTSASYDPSWTVRFVPTVAAAEGAL